ncbi:hypothetical protein [Paenibacillus crassostreae]|uniref:Uncharacterized protein n=1 Tax=Paenibacillus crassostreae TaxID=1763538 RepID=A0A167AUN8_9BACL|nr:hypothetical protein [Paenibacillus crassostreae]AOZ93623.1 hypothetical protein LPB68_16440 [Paenibacillus crassostreae]OAB71450.1 hypothetical protein PNBC_19310 [Paenibacillus crassostreae]
MSVNIKIYPDYFPANCPPNDALEEEIIVYRLCESNPVSENDFLSHFILNPNRNYNGKLQAFGLSVISDIEEIEKMRNISPIMRKKKYVATGMTMGSSGVIKKTPSNNCNSHITWWLIKEALPHAYFEVCKEVV